MKVSLSAIHPFASYLIDRGFPEKTIYSTLDIPRKTLREAPGGTMVSLLKFGELLQAASTQLADPAMGLHYGQMLNLEALRSVDVLSRECETIGEGLGHLAAYFQDEFPAIELLASLEDGYLKMILAPIPGWKEAQPEAAEAFTAANAMFIFRQMQYMFAGDGSKVVLGIRGEKEHVESLRKMSGVQARRAADCTIAFPERLLDLRIVRPHDYRLNKVVAKLDDAIAASRAEQGSFEQQARICVLHLVGQTSLPQVDEIAWNFGLSRRSFQRKLKAEGHTFRDLLETVLRDLSRRFLEETTMTVSEIALALGYSEPAAFIHAFQRWHNMAPLEMREAMRS